MGHELRNPLAAIMTCSEVLHSLDLQAPMPGAACRPSRRSRRRSSVCSTICPMSPGSLGASSPRLAGIDRHLVKPVAVPEIEAAIAGP
ncbi:hypothetical protein CKO40_10560 [Halochromatium glycolicum]|uniref:histidine kinase n=1 Tax=Halochromatium glycolicum TaxID=85075 RepID=A0AAJ0U4H8_9GAMM|nr:hypothetical protein [Halochromatium glycolicum]